MTAFVESCVETVAGSATQVEKQTRSRGRPRARQLLRVLADKKNILITTHEQPDPDALASSIALEHLLSSLLPKAQIGIAIKGQLGGGLNQIFAQEAGSHRLTWNDEALKDFDAIVLVDTQPSFDNSPLPEGLAPTAVIDHHPSRRGRRPHTQFVDIRSDVGASGSIIFSYFMELDVDIPRDVAALLLFAIESDLAGAASAPDELDNVALSSLTLRADPRKLYRMRYAELPQSYYVAYFNALNNAVFYDNALVSHLDAIDSPEKQAIMADFLLRFDQVQWVLVTAINHQKLVMSLRSSDPKQSAAELMRKLVRRLGEGGGHRAKAGGWVPLANGTPTEIERLRTLLRRRYLRALNIKNPRGQRLVPKPESGK